ncbi:hypothetical protein ACSBR1_016963 [Camellia fascicularis]
MAESAVTFLLKKLSSLVEEELKSLGGVQAEIVFIRDELQSMSAFLRVADAIEDTDLQTWVHQITDLAYHIDNILDQFTIRFAPHHHHRHGFFYESVYKIYYQIKIPHLQKFIKSIHHFAFIRSKSLICKNLISWKKTTVNDPKSSNP